VETVYESHLHDVPPGSRLYLFSDGVFEAEVENGELLGLDGLAALLRTSKSAEARPRFVYEEVRQRQGPRELLDDISLLELRFA
jgi:serine phosphatase RsbU (regulator of sigma subunit)